MHVTTTMKDAVADVAKRVVLQSTRDLRRNGTLGQPVASPCRQDR